MKDLLETLLNRLLEVIEAMSFLRLWGGGGLHLFPDSEYTPQTS